MSGYVGGTSGTTGTSRTSSTKRVEVGVENGEGYGGRGIGAENG